MLRETRIIILDIATSALPNAAEFIDVDSISAPSNWKDPAKIDAYKAEKLAERLDSAALDFDLARITGIGWAGDMAGIALCRDEESERLELTYLAERLIGPTWLEWDTEKSARQPARSDYRLISYNGLAFDWPMLMRRARYLGVPFPVINTDRYKSPHVDLLALLSDRDPSRRRSLGFYVKRLSMGLVKPLTGAQEAQVPVTGAWAGLEASLRHDVEAIDRLAKWLGVL